MLASWKRLAGWAAVAALALGCTKPAGDEPGKTIHVYNPFRADGLPPYLHCGSVGWSTLAPMTDEGCQWYRYEVRGMPGPFRFYGSGWTGPRWGTTGMVTDPNLDNEPNVPTFNEDGYFASADDVWLDTHLDSNTTDPTTTRPFQCDPTTIPAATNPYGRGQVPTYSSPSHLPPLFDLWLGQFYEESGNLARIKFTDPTLTVSEGIGYGMLIFVFADAAGEQKARFDKLWSYYNAFLDPNGLMHWTIQGFSGPAQVNSASDADLDVAVALLVAGAKWNDPTYTAAAQTLIARIRQFEFNAAGYLKPGDAWDTAKNPSYVSFVAFELFQRVDSGYDSFWADALTRHYALLLAARNPSTGLVPNWTNEAGVATNPLNGYPHDWSAFGFDAIRVPWRAAWAYLWFGAAHQTAYDVANGICDFVTTASGGDPMNIRAEYTVAGAPTGEQPTLPAGPGVVGAFATACMLDPADVAMLDSAYGRMRTQTAGYDVNYYQTTLQVLEALLLTGSMPNPWGG